MTICKNLTDEQVKTAFKQFDTSGDDKLDYRHEGIFFQNF